MSFIYRIISKYVVQFLKRLWRRFKVEEAKKIAKVKVEEAKSAKEVSDKSYDDFKSLYDKYREQSGRED